MTLPTLLALVSSILFAASGMSCLLGLDMRSEFGRFGLDRLRTLTGALELLGAAGLIVGLWWPLALELAAGGLTLLMVAAVAVRLRQRDTPWQILPAALLACVNGVILVESLRR